jgi:hypothetical protein
MEGSVVPGDELPVVPDFVGFLNRHADSFGIKIRGSGRGILRINSLIEEISPSRMKL